MERKSDRDTTLLENSSACIGTKTEGKSAALKGALASAQVEQLKLAELLQRDGPCHDCGSGTSGVQEVHETVSGVSES